jgi:hypothetical protein
MPLEAHQSIHWSPKEPAPVCTQQKIFKLIIGIFLILLSLIIILVVIDYNTEEEQKRKRDAKKEQLRKYYELQNSDPNSDVNKFRNYHHI